MFKLLQPLPRNILLACSGGVDSMAVLDFLRRSHAVSVLHVNHHTSHGDRAEAWMRDYCGHAQIDLQVKRIERDKLRRQGKTPTGADLAVGLLSYSTRGADYVQQVQRLIRSRDLGCFDRN